MSFLNDLKHLVVEEDNKDEKAPESNPVPPTTQPTRTSNIPGIPGLAGIPGLSSTPAAAPVQQVPTFTPTGPVTVTADANLAGQMAAKLREKFAGSPYNAILNQFSTTLAGLTEDIPEEGRRFRAALKLQSNVTSDQLVAAYQSLIDVLEQEAAGFQQKVGQMQSKEVDAREQQVQQINAQIEGKSKEIQGLMAQRDQIGNDIVGAKQTIGSKVASFEGAVSSLRSEVNDSIQKLRIYFPTAAAAAPKK